MDFPLDKLKKLKEMLGAIEDDQFYIPNYNMAIPVVESLKKEKISIQSLPFNGKSYNSWDDLLQDLQKMKGDPELRKEREVIENKADEERISKSHANAVKKTEERRKKIEEEYVLEMKKIRNKVSKKQKSQIEKIWHVYFITHIDNLVSILKKGILSPNNADKLEIRPTEISNKSIVGKREAIFVGGKSLADYAHVFFNPRNAMLYQKLQENKLMVIIESVIDVSDVRIYITNKNVATDGFESWNGLEYYQIIPRIEQDTLPIGRGWSKRPNWAGEADKSKLMAECLVPDKIPPECFESIHVCNLDMKEKIKPLLTEPKLEIIVDPSMFFNGEC